MNRDEHSNPATTDRPSADTLPEATWSPSQDSFTRFAVPLCAAAVLAVFALSRAWICDDAYITFRYVANTLAGHGPVFNIGERVQGYTHPLWFLLLTPCSVFVDAPMAALGLGVACAFASGFVLARRFVSLHFPFVGVLPAAMILLSSKTFLEFETSGLENALTILLLAMILAATLPCRETIRPGRLAVCCGLVVLNRLDHVFLVGPVWAMAAIRLLSGSRSDRSVGKVVLSLAPIFLWSAFATIYYGTPLPNTYYAKFGAYPLGTAIKQGLLYVQDYAHHEPLQSAFVAFALPACAVFFRVPRPYLRASNAFPFCLVIGTVLQLLYVISIGGDFMRGRFLTSIVFTLAVLASHCISKFLAQRTQLGFVIAVGAMLFVVPPPLHPEDEPLPDGIVRESEYYRGQWLVNASRTGIRPRHGGLGNELRDYAEIFGPITVTSGALGSMAYHAGPLVTVLDTNGLTDAFVARCPPKGRVRIGHFHRDVPDDYYRSRGAINRVQKWRARVKKLDGSLRREAMRHRRPPWGNQDAFAAYQNVQAITTLPVLSPKRLHQLLNYTISRSAWSENPPRIGVGLAGATVTTNYVPDFGSPSHILEYENKRDGFAWNTAGKTVCLNDRFSEVLIDLHKEAKIDALSLQADYNDHYIVDFAPDGTHFSDPWIARPLVDKGMRTRTTPPGFSRSARWLRIRARGPDRRYAISMLRLSTGFDAFLLRPASASVTANYKPRFGKLSYILDYDGKPDGISWSTPGKCVCLNDQESAVIINLHDTRKVLGIAIQADGNDRYILEFSTDGENFAGAWTAQPTKAYGMQTRSTEAGFSRAAKYIRIRAAGEDPRYSLSKVMVSLAR